MKRPISSQFQDDVAATYMSKSKLIGIYNSIFVMFSVLLISFVFTNTAFAQQKSNAVEQAEAQLIVVNQKIAEIDAKITAINTRIAGIPVENVDPSVFVRLNDLQLTKEQYIREKISIEAVLNAVDDGVQTDSYALPADNQDYIIE